jgi:drug/metabolite transporter (DMT)-like permease
MKPALGIALWALFAAVGNAIYVYGARKAVTGQSTYLFITGVLVCSAAMVAAMSATTKQPDAAEMFQRTWPMMLLAGAGAAITFIGFQGLFANYGPSQYSVYAMFALLTTSIGIGVLVFKENFNIYHGLAMVCAMAALVFFFLGQNKK